MSIKTTAAATATALLLLFSGCSNLDDSTDLGAGYVKNQGNFDVKEFESQNLSVLAGTSFLDLTDSIAPSLVYNSDLATGRFANMRTVSYLEFSNEALYELMTDIMKDSGNVKSFKLKFEVDTAKSSTNKAFIELGTSYLHNHLVKFEENHPSNKEIAYANTETFLDTANTIEFNLDSSYFHFNITSYDSITYIDSLKKFDTTTIYDTNFVETFKDTNTTFSISGIKTLTVIQGLDSNKVMETLGSLAIYDSTTKEEIEYKYGVNAFKQLHFDTTYILTDSSDASIHKELTVAPDSLSAGQALDTTVDTIPQILMTMSYLDTTVTIDTINEKEAYDDTVSYDYLSSIYGKIKYVLSDTIKSTDTSKVSIYDSLTIDTIYFKSSENIISSDISTIKNSNGEISYDTNYISIEKLTDISILKVTDIVLKDTVSGISSKIKDDDYWLIDTTWNENSDSILSIDTLQQFTFYLKQLSDKPNTLQFYKNPRIEVTYLKDGSSEDYVKTLVPFYRNYTVYEDGDISTLESSAISNGAPDRMLRLKLDISEIWDNMRDSSNTADTGFILYENIPQFDVTLKMDTAIYHPLTCKKANDSSAYTYLFYKASTSPITSVWDQSLNDGKGAQISRSVSDTLILDDVNNKSENTITLHISKYIQEFLNEAEVKDPDQPEVPNDIYLTVWVYDDSFTQISFDTSSYDMTYIISNLKEDN